MRLNELKPADGAKHAKKRVGRGMGSGLGKTAGRGHKGQKSRSGGFHKVGFEGGQMPLHMRLPKLRGFTNPFRVEFQTVNVDKLASLFPEGGTVTIDDLVAKGAVRANQPVKVLGNGSIDVKVDVTVTAASASAKQKIEAAGGSVSVA